MRRVLGLGGIVQDRPGEAIRLVEVLVGQPDKRGPTVARLAEMGGQPLRQVVGLGRSVHDDMTPGQREMFIRIDANGLHGSQAAANTP